MHPTLSKNGFTVAFTVSLQMKDINIQHTWLSSDVITVCLIKYKQTVPNFIEVTFEKQNKKFLFHTIIARNVFSYVLKGTLETLYVKKIWRWQCHHEETGDNFLKRKSEWHRYVAQLEWQNWNWLYYGRKSLALLLYIWSHSCFVCLSWVSKHNDSNMAAERE